MADSLPGPASTRGGLGWRLSKTPANMDLVQEILNADRRIRSHIRETPLDYSLPLSQITGSQVYLKLENLQYTGSFKTRGAMNKILSLSPEQRAAGIVAASSGNHGAAVAFCLQKVNAKGTIFVPTIASPTKVEAIRRYGVDTRFHGEDCVLTEQFAREFARQRGMTYVSPYNDLQVIGGQGTIATEISRRLDPVHAVFVALGGGGLVSGIAGYLKSIQKRVKVFGCSPENSPVMIESLRANHILDMESKPTLSDGTAGGVEPDSITFDLCRDLVDEWVLVSEDEIRMAMLLFLENHHMMIEGAAGVAIASFLKNKNSLRAMNVIIVICGANISLESLKSIL